MHFASHTFACALFCSCSTCRVPHPCDLTMPSQSETKLRLGRMALAECVGTYLLVLFGTGSVASAAITGSAQGLWQVAVVWWVPVTSYPGFVSWQCRTYFVLTMDSLQGGLEYHLRFTPQQVRMLHAHHGLFVTPVHFASKHQNQLCFACCFSWLKFGHLLVCTRALGVSGAHLNPAVTFALVLFGWGTISKDQQP